MSFSGDIEAFTKKTEVITLSVFKKVSFDVFGRVVRRTPVDTGRLKGNWHITPNITLGKRVFISNNLPYAQAIEDGHSKQAPAGMVKVTVAEFLPIVNKAVRMNR